ncbi:MAG: sortase [Candidatus Gracilibacteria bacterium]
MNLENAQNQPVKLHLDPQKSDGPTLKGILHDIGRQALASLIILVIGFFALNYSAYFQIAKNEFNKYFGNETASPLNQLVETKTPATSLTTNQEIPDLNLEIMPSDNRIVIPRIDKNIPVISTSSQSLINRDWDGLEKELMQALQNGVVHYPGTNTPGQGGNTVITGHSSYFPWDPGRFKDVFALLHEVVVGDKIVVYYDQEKYVYEVSEIKIVLPNELDVLKNTTDETLTLITCTPVGTNLKRLIVIAKPV